MSAARRTAVFIDGFNLYHGLCNTRRNELKWLSLARLARRLVPPRSHGISAVYYFSAVAEHLPDRAVRHRIYIDALKAEGVTAILGEFKDKEKPFRCCFGCFHSATGKEEKQTDVNIALELVSRAYRDEFDTAVLVSADSDLLPVVTFMKREFPDKELIVAMPPYRGSDALRQASDAKRRIRADLVSECLLPSTLRSVDGRLIHRPEEYAPPARS